MRFSRSREHALERRVLQDAPQPAENLLLGGGEGFVGNSSVKKARVLGGKASIAGM